MAHPLANTPAPPPALMGGFTESTQELLEQLDRLDQASRFVNSAISNVNLLLEKFASIQVVDEDHSKRETSNEDLETAWAKINLLVHQCDLIARKPILNDVRALEGGTYSYGSGLEVTLPNLRSRGPDSLGLLEEVDSQYLFVSGRGPVIGGSPPTLISVNDEDDEDEPAKKKKKQPPLVGAGKYRVEVHYVGAEGSKVHIYLYNQISPRPIEELLNVDISNSNSKAFALFDNGLALMLENSALFEESEKESTSTIQHLELRQETGERLATLDGILCSDSQPRDFEAHSLFMEDAVHAANDALEALRTFQNDIEDTYEHIYDTWAYITPERDQMLGKLKPNRKAWPYLNMGGLIRVLGEHEPDHKDPVWHYIKQMHQNAKAPELLRRALERASWDLNDEKTLAFLERMAEIRRTVDFDNDRHVGTAVGILLALAQTSQAMVSNDIDTAKAHLLTLMEACRYTPNQQQQQRRRDRLVREL